MDKQVIAEEVNWLDLPFHLMSLILLKLVYIKDYIHFGAVCQSWYSIYKQNLDDYILHLPRQLPILLVTTEPLPEFHEYHHWQTHNFFDLSENRVCEFPLPVPHYTYYYSFYSSQGWLIYDDCSEVSLFNPFLSDDNVITLPALEDESDLDEIVGMKKAVLSASPALNPNNYILMAACSRRWVAAFYKPGNRGWTPLLNRQGVSVDLEDVIYDGKQYFYAMDREGSIWACDLSSSCPNVSKVASCIYNNVVDDCLGEFEFGMKYLVESSGELLVILRNGNRDDPACYTLNFKVFKLDQNTMKWNETKSLCGRSLFVGSNTSMSVLASDFPICKPNCIYFTDRGFERMEFYSEFYSEEAPHDMGVYNLEDGTIEPYYPMESIKYKHTTPMWVEPTLSK
ncbi:hypothetical protein AQUCO_01300913v1 [Aquilegia coerulea]|uniref:Uncharacterized protein n=1 Tax=Aquilegia coerulea TaxID=218851 RepID=A0A2G5E3Z2_AQUCA|nr:hypothetical protein AQUCO_01300913v1 [Aquilegia coerulea]